MARQEFQGVAGHAAATFSFDCKERDFLPHRNKKNPRPVEGSGVLSCVAFRVETLPRPYGEGATMMIPSPRVEPIVPPFCRKWILANALSWQ